MLRELLQLMRGRARRSCLLLLLLSGLACAEEEPDFPLKHTYIAPVSSAEGYYPVCRYRFELADLVALPMLGLANILDPEQIFSADTNQQSKIALYKEGKVRIWARASPLLTHVWISDDSRYIVGLSNLKFVNPYQLVVFDREGNLLHAQCIFAQGAKFRPEEIAEFFGAEGGHPFYSFGRLEHEGFIYLNLQGIDFTFDDPEIHLKFKGIDPEKLKELLRPNTEGFSFAAPEIQKQIEQRTVPNPLFPHIRETPDYFVYWFDEKDPQLAIQEEDGQATLTFADPSGQLITLPLNKAAP